MPVDGNRKKGGPSHVHGVITTFATDTAVISMDGPHKPVIMIRVGGCPVYVVLCDH